MNRFLATTALVMLMGAAPALAQSPDTPGSLAGAGVPVVPLSSDSDWPPALPLDALSEVDMV